MSPIVSRWRDTHTEELSLATLRKLHGPPTKYRVSRYEYPVGTSFPGRMLSARCFVISGACQYHFDVDVALRGGDWTDLPSGSYVFRTVGDCPVELVLVWEIPSRSDWKHSADERSQSARRGR